MIGIFDYNKISSLFTAVQNKHGQHFFIWKTLLYAIKNQAIETGPLLNGFIKA
jgi:hypothetical protein